jgi:phage-related protein
VRAGAAAVRSTVDNTVGSVASGVLSFARGLPIPNLPGVGSVRAWILSAAERVSGRVRSAIAVTGLVAAVVGETAGLVERVAPTAYDAIRRVGDAVRSMIDRGIAAISGALRRVIRGVTSALRSAWTTAQAAVRRLFNRGFPGRSAWRWLVPRWFRTSRTWCAGCSRSGRALRCQFGAGETDFDHFRPT